MGKYKMFGIPRVSSGWDTLSVSYYLGYCPNLKISPDAIE